MFSMLEEPWHWRGNLKESLQSISSSQIKFRICFKTLIAHFTQQHAHSSTRRIDTTCDIPRLRDLMFGHARKQD